MYNSNTKASDMPNIDKYKKALLAEMYYLKEQGGRKYRVTNGNLMSQNSSGYYYAFDLETELHIADDTPMSLQVGEVKVAGIVQFCEDVSGKLNSIETGN
jgi:hypothetical protein